MEISEARKIIGEKYFDNNSLTFEKNSNGWSSFTGDTICLDGYYDVEELEAFITIMKSYGDKN